MRPLLAGLLLQKPISLQILSLATVTGVVNKVQLMRQHQNMFKPSQQMMQVSLRLQQPTKLLCAMQLENLLF
ncbi:hypothetical protein BMF29_12010 [Comamonas kerstersii]|nr:hypothetical protein BMF38_15215 [Comamonas kerstersii]OOH90690.1 hypothetical protein BMF29_12010 [Comamonas kerstersii]